MTRQLTDLLIAINLWNINFLPDTDVKVQKICLGTMTWGRQNNEADAHAQMDFALDQGVNFFDTAELYPIPPRKDEQGDTECFIGKWLRNSACYKSL